MARDPRTWLPGVTYHCYSRCLKMQNLLASIWVQEMAAEVINVALEKYSFELIEMTFVNNHFHFLIRTVEGGENISRIMQYIKARIGENYNRKMGVSGPFWHDRFKCKIIELVRNPVSYFFNAVLYIGYNRVVKGIDSEPGDSKFNTFQIMVKEDYIPPVKTTFHPYFLSLGKTHAERTAALKKVEKSYRKRVLKKRKPLPVPL